LGEDLRRRFRSTAEINEFLEELFETCWRDDF
jgi:hypothetical protein